MTSRLAGAATRFRPFNQGRNGGAGNPPVAPIGGAYPTDYLWNRIWARDSVLDLIQQFVHEDRSGQSKLRGNLIFPRYQQTPSDSYLFLPVLLMGFVAPVPAV